LNIKQKNFDGRLPPGRPSGYGPDLALPAAFVKPGIRVLMADYTLDFRNTFSSISLLKMTEIFGRMLPRETLEICGSDPDIRRDLLKVLPENSYDLVTIDEDKGGQDCYTIRIRKRCR
jgi:TusA-related sulfurtransferase